MLRFGFLAGLPRTGSTLLTCIMGQNPDVHVSGGSPLARIMFGTYQTCELYAREGLVRARRTEFAHELLSEIPRLYYRDVRQRYILEKDRAWSHDPLGLLSYITSEPRVVVLLRSIPDIVRSFVHVKVTNGDVLPERDLLVKGCDPMLDAFQNTINALQSDDDRFLFGTYDQLVSDPRRFIEAIYHHYGWESYQHNLDHIVDLHLEDDAAEQTDGLHDVRSVIARRTLATRISTSLMKQAQEYDDVLWQKVRFSMEATPHRHL